MATMVVRGNSHSQLPHQESGHRNKRKFRAEPPASLPLDSPGYEFPVEFNSEEHENGACDICNSLQCPKDEELDMEDLPDADWSLLTESQLKELLLRNLDAIFSSAIKKVASHGFSEEEARNAMLRSGLRYGTKDAVTNIVDSTLEFLRSEQMVDGASEHCFEDLNQLEEYVLSEMVLMLREVRPFFSAGDAMWCLLICDMDSSHACAANSDVLGAFGGEESTFLSSVPQIQPGLDPSGVSSICGPFEFNSGRTRRPNNALVPGSQTSMLHDLPHVSGIPNLPPVKFSSSNNSSGASTSTATSQMNAAKENVPSFADCVVEEFSSASVSDAQVPIEKLVNGRRCNGVGVSKRDSIPRHKSMYFEKGHRVHRSKGALRSGKVSNLGSLLDRKCKPASDPMGVSLKNSMLKNSKQLGMDSLQADDNLSLSFNAPSSAKFPLDSKTDSSSASQLPTANTELSLSLSSKSAASSFCSSTSNVPSNCFNEMTNYCNYSGSLSEKLSRQLIFQDKKDEIVHKLVSRARELQTQLQEWSEWAQAKVMQAAHRLGKDREELQALRQEKEDIDRLQKEKQSLEENNKKKISDLECALAKAAFQFEKANASKYRLELENAQLRQQMEGAKLCAAKLAANCKETSKRETTTLKSFQSWDRQKAQLQEELMVSKQKLFQLQKQHDHEKAFLEQLEVKLKREEQTRDDVLMLVQSERKEREQIEISAKSKEDTIRLKIENDLILYKEDMRRLENQISQLRLQTDISKITALRQGVNSSYASRLASGVSSSQKDVGVHYCSQIVNLQELDCNEVLRERECVMCLTEEMSVVFLPCAHQVVCGTCNKLHEQQGMKDCPSCRTPIQRRITTRSHS